MTESRAEESNIAESLKSLGLTRYEALVYIALLKSTGATATEIHEISGVPRASVYPVLDRLLQKNLVSVSHTSPKRFSAIPPEEGIDSLMHNIEEDATRAKTVLSAIFRERTQVERGDQELIWSIQGIEKITARLIDLIRHAEQTVLIITYHDFLANGLTEAILEVKKSVRVELISDHWEGPVPAHIKIYLKVIPQGHDLTMAKDFAGGVFIFDSRKVLVVMGSRSEGATGLFSEAPGFVRFFNRYWNFFSDYGGISSP
jgi:sugar-specific transcriptional regulator TrmB